LMSISKITSLFPERSSTGLTIVYRDESSYRKACLMYSALNQLYD
jgi:hypothetical protein